MPLFKRHNTPPPPPPPPEPEHRGLFGRKKTPPQTSPTQYDHRGNPVYNGRTSDESLNRSGTTRSGGLFHRNHSPVSDRSVGTGAGAAGVGSGVGGMFGKGHLNDPSITNARQRVAEAEVAERQADQALMASRAAVQQAREHVRILEREVEEE
jgi:hypothetical protein